MSVTSSTTPDGVMDAAITTVMDRIENMDRIASRYQKELSESLANISSVKIAPIDPPKSLNLPNTDIPKVDLGDVPVFKAIPFNQPNSPIFTDITTLLNDLDLSDLDIPTMPVMPSVELPSMPGMNQVLVPDRPDYDTNIELPEAPTIILPDLEELVQITIPEFTFEEMPDFEGVPPSISDITIPSVFIDWSEPDYESDFIEDLHIEIKKGMQEGGTGLPKDIEEAMFNRARSRESKETERAVKEAVQEWSSRNYSMPPGMLVKQVAVLREEGRLKSSELNRDILIEATKMEIDNIRFLIQQGMALEQITSNLHNNMANRMLEVARFEAESLITVFNAQISLFNAQNAAFESLTSVYKTKLEGALAKLSAYKTSVDAQVAIGQINEQRVAVFKAKTESVLSSVEIYKALVSGASIRADVLKTKFDAYRSEVQVYSEQINAEKVRVEAYEAQVRGETSKVNMFEAQARAFASSVQAVQAKADVKSKSIQLKMEAAKTWIQKYSADVDGYKANLQASLNEVQLNTTAFGAQVEAWKAGAGMEVSQAEMQSRYADMNVRTNIAHAEMQIKEYESKAQRALQEAQLALEAAKSLGQYTAQLAAGAMSAAHVSASISGSGSSSASVSRSNSESTSHNYTY